MSLSLAVVAFFLAGMLALSVLVSRMLTIPGWDALAMVGCATLLTILIRARK